MILWQASFFGVSLRIESCLFMVFPPFPEHRRHACSFFVGLFFSVLPPRTTAYRRGGFPNLCLSVAPAAWNAFSCSGVMAAGAAPLRSLWLLRSCAAARAPRGAGPRRRPAPLVWPRSVFDGFRTHGCGRKRPRNRIFRRRASASFSRRRSPKFSAKRCASRSLLRLTCRKDTL